MLVLTRDNGRFKGWEERYRKQPGQKHTVSDLILVNEVRFLWNVVIRKYVSGTVIYGGLMDVPHSILKSYMVYVI